MSRVVLLPRPRDPQNGWPQGDTFPLKKALVVANLSADEHALAEGIPSPWARALLMNWRLENQSSPSGIAAISELKALVEAQFLGRLKGELIELSNGSEGLGRFCRVLRLNSSYSSLILWRANDFPPFRQDEVIAGTTSDCPFFSAADVDAEALNRALRASFGPPLSGALLDAQGEIIAPDFAETLADYLRDLGGILPGSKWRIALENWRKELVKLKGRSVSTAARSFVLDGLSITTRIWMDQAPWDCPECVDLRRSWVNSRGTIQRLTTQQSEILCPEHHVAICKNSGKVIQLATQTSALIARKNMWRLGASSSMSFTYGATLRLGRAVRLRAELSHARPLPMSSISSTIK